jgi:primosomal protein N' (replication factor Y) (superfamily II helicase)
MFITKVLPIKKGLRKELLSYFSAEAVSPGSIVEVPVRGKSYTGLVVESEEAASSKTEIKSSPFALRKVSSLKSEPFFSRTWLDAADETAKFFGATAIETISSLIPAAVIENIPSLSKSSYEKPAVRKEEEPGELYVHQAVEEERILNYRSLVRETFAKKKSIFIALPTNKDVEELSKVLEKGIERYVFPFYSDMPKKELLKKWNAAVEEEHPVLVLGSALWLCLPRQDFQTIVMEKENHSGWKILKRPHLDLRKFVEIYREKLKARLILGDTVLRVESIWKFKEDKALEFESMKMRIYPTEKGEVVDMQKGEFAAVSERLIELIKQVREANGRIFIYATRKGLSSLTVCRDCGVEVVCTNCGSPVVLYKGREEEYNIFRCHQCGETRSAKEFCKNCGSWRLVALGTGIERVEEEIRQAIPDIKIFRINKEATPKAKDATEQAEQFYATPGSVMLGTEMAMFYLNEKVDATAVASIDPLFFVPDWRIREKIFHLLLNIRLLALGRSLVQIRKGGRDTVALALEGDIGEFYKREIKERELFQYPPFGVFVKVTARGDKEAMKKEGEMLAKFFEKWSPAIFPSTSERKKLEAAVNCVIKLPAEDWPNNELLTKLNSLPPAIEIKVNPDNLL